MIYLDTSFVAPLVIAEDTSDAVEAFVRRIKPGELATSHWTRVELASLVARKHRMGELSEPQAEAVRSELERLLDESFDLLLPTAADFAAAGKFLALPETGLRAGDALHLAVAASHGASKVLTLDAGFIAAGKLLKLPVAAASEHRAACTGDNASFENENNEQRILRTADPQLSLP